MSDEKIISALLTNGTVRAAAQAAGVSESTIYNRLKTPEFFTQLQARRAEYLRETLNAVQAKTQSAINVISEIMEDESLNAQWRLAAAESILRKSAELSKEVAIKENSAVQRDIFDF